MLVVCERWVGDGDWLLHIDPKVLLTIAALLSHSGWAAQPWVTDGPSSLSGAGSHSAGILSPTGTGTPQAVCGTWLYNCLTSTCFLYAYASATITEFNHVHRSRWYSDIFDGMHLFRCSSAYLHSCISWLTARSRVNMLQTLMPRVKTWILLFSSQLWINRRGHWTL